MQRSSLIYFGRKDSTKEGGQRETHNDLNFKKARSEAKNNSNLSLRWVKWHQKQHQRLTPSTLITTNNSEPVAFGSLLMERDGKQKCVASHAKFNGI
jgi:hypothetical protein